MSATIIRDCCRHTNTKNTFHLARERLWYFLVNVKLMFSSIRAIYIYKNIYMYNNRYNHTGDCQV